MTTARASTVGVSGATSDEPAVTLQIRYEGYGSTLTLETLTDQLATLGWVVALAKAVAAREDREPSPADLPLGQERVSETRVLSVSYENPIEIVLLVKAAIVASPVAISALVYGLKRLYGLDLELRTAREKRRREFYEAKAAADELAPQEVKGAIDAKHKRAVRGQAVLDDSS